MKPCSENETISPPPGSLFRRFESIVLYCARHRFSTDAYEGTGNLMAVMDVMGHSRVDVTRIYQHPGLAHVTEAIDRRNQQRVQ